ncbi:AfsR/SARP family transcriptional regulator [Nocardioides sp. AX2bis]|uniref:AfsR/SARP family transcriptional regulator n=1 Tax=Nocardioides sp. AX2bis TaxID=2653157 RepID=UPI0012F15FD2|nr:BTAD domain-containing putative transcriptional regulator [Nocardioides sp. AX2bis]VXB16467.1 conserved hypothetical protein [Nocardioides sp. AX2bis]
MQVKIFGQTRVVTPRGEADGGRLGGVKSRQILEILAVSAGSPVSKEVLADLLWSGHPPRSWTGTLESYVCLLRRHLDPTSPRTGGIVTVRQGYLLDLASVDVDLTTFRALARRAEADRDPATCLAIVLEALSIATGDLLADEMQAPWADEEREVLRQEMVSLHGLAASCGLALEQTGVAIRHARAALRLDPLAEGVWRTLMRSLAAAGRRAEALRAHSEVRRHLADELGTDPSRETTDLYLDLLRGAGAPGTAAGTVQPREEVRILLRLLHDAVLAVPVGEVPDGDPHWWQTAVRLGAAS